MAEGASRVLEGTVIEETVTLTLSELSGACSVRAEVIVELVEEGVLEPVEEASGELWFSGASLGRARRAVRLQQDLGVNAAGAALIVDLLDELEALRRRMRELEVTDGD